MPLVDYPLDVYGWRRKRAQGGMNNGEFLQTVDFYYLSCLPGPQLLDLRSITTRPTTIRQWENFNSTMGPGSYTGFAQPGETATVFAPGLPSTPPVWAARPGCPVIVLVRTHALAHPDTATPDGSLDLTLTDVHGGRHRLRVSFAAPDNRHFLVLSKR